MKRVLLMLFWPQAVWEHLRARPRSVPGLMLRIVLPFAVAIAIAVQVGISVLNAHWSPAWGYNPDPIFGRATAPMAFVVAFAGPLLLAAVFVLLAPLCGARRDFELSLNLAVHGTIPFWLAASLLFFMPALVLCMFAVAHSFFLLAQGARILLGMDADDSAQFVMGGALFTGTIFLFLGIGAGSALV